jgi:hypothetical protein
MWRDQTLHITGSSEKIFGGGGGWKLWWEVYVCWHVTRLLPSFCLHDTAPPLNAVGPKIQVQSIQVNRHHLHHGMTLDLVDHDIDWGGCLESSCLGQTLIASLHPVTGHLQMLTDIMMDVMQLFDEAHCVVSHRFRLVCGSPKQYVTG